MRRFCVIVVLALASTGCSRKAPLTTQDAASPAPTTHPFSSLETPSGAISQPGEYKAREERPIYPFSLVPGGVYSVQELQSALKVSQDLRAHYSDLDASRIRLVRLKQNMPAYVSYRHGGQIFWTRHPLMLHAGELVLTDGHYSVRARCANQISMVPREPVEVSPEKVENQLDAPIMQAPMDYARLGPLNSVLFPATSAVPVGPPSSGVPPAGAPPTGVVVTGNAPSPPVPPVVPIVPVCTTCGGPGTTPTPPPVPVPEPESSVLAALSLAFVAGILILRRFQRKPTG